MLRVLVGDGDIDYLSILACEEGGSLPQWVVPKDAAPEDEAVMFVQGRGFVARASISSVPTAAMFGNQHAYRSGLSDVSCLPVPVPLAYVEERLPTWGWLRQRMKSRTTPDATVAETLVQLLSDYQSDFESLGESATIMFSEGDPRRALAMRYERNPGARFACIDRHGSSCAVCGFEFGAAYGPSVEGFILVHHLEMLSAGRRKRAVDPARDMRPVCANCHVVMHRKNPPFTVAQVKRMLRNRSAG